MIRRERVSLPWLLALLLELMPSMFALTVTSSISRLTVGMSGMTSQPSIGSFLASLEGTGLETGLNVDHVRALDEYWAQMRLLYSCFEADLKGPDNEVYVHEIPGGQLTNLKFQATQLGLGTQWLGTLPSDLC
jgi:pyruvate carboxylase